MIIVYHLPCHGITPEKEIFPPGRCVYLTAAHVTRFFSAHHSSGRFYYDADVSQEILNSDSISDSAVYITQILAAHHEAGYFLLNSLSYLNSVGFNDLSGLVSENHFLCQHMY